MIRNYVVKKGDTLTKIAVKEGVDKQELAALNGIHNLNLIKVDQVLILPLKSVDMTSAEPGAVSIPELESLKVIACQFIDASNSPIEGMDVAVTVGRHETKHATDSEGFIPAISLAPEDVVKVAVKKATGEWKPVSEIKPVAPTTHARIVSPKVKKLSETQVHDGPTQTTKTDKPVPQAVGSAIVVRGEDGHPVQRVALECPNPENLKLGENYKYRNIILDASRRSKLSPQSIAAIMNAEAATIVVEIQKAIVDKKTGKPLVGKDGKPLFKTFPTATGEWNPRSANPRSSARGMTQFLDGTWISLAMTEGTYLYERAQKEGWLTTVIKAVKRGKKAVEKTYRAFKLADGTLVTGTTSAGLSRNLSSHKYIIGYAQSIDANIQKLLDLRYEAEYAIHTAVDYGLQNLAGLEAAGFKTSGLTDGEKAKLVYLTHHLGLSDATSFIKNAMDEKHAKYLLIQQVGASGAKERSEDCEDSYLKAHRQWLSLFIDDKIDISKKMCIKTGSLPRNLIEVTIAIR